MRPPALLALLLPALAHAVFSCTPTDGVCYSASL
jgi:hypothetical protein